MAAINTALLQRGIEQKDIQTSRFSIRPVYAPHDVRTEPKLLGYNVSNQVSVKIRNIGDLGEILDQLVTAGATDVGNIAFLVSDASKAADQAREAAMADARRKACRTRSDASIGSVGCDGSDSANLRRRG